MPGKADKTGSTGARNGSTTRQEQVVDRRRSLLEAAVRVISKKGLIGVTISSIAAEAKCSYGVVAFHFQSKEGVIFAALDHTAAEYEAHLKALAGRDMGPAARLRAMIDTDFSRKAAGRGNIALWLAFWAEAVRVPSFRKRCGELREQYNSAVTTDVVELAQERGVEVKAEQIALTLNTMISGLWIEAILTARPLAEAQQRGRDACLSYMRLHFPQDF
jgi:TetR/AcrR family transcriptional regulator, transcriptional repressor of bet genes